MKLLFISSLLVAATNAADVDRRRINGITFADQAVEALNLVHKGQASQASSSTVLIKKGESDNKGGDDKSSRDDKSSNDKSSNSKSSSSNSSGSSRDGRGVCGESDDYCKNYDSSSFLNIKKEDGGNKGGDNKSSRDEKSSNDKSSGSSKSKSSSSSTNSRDGERRTDRCFRACDTDRCTSDDRRRLACPDSTAASSDMKFVQKGQASPIQKLVWAAKGEDEGGDDPKTSKDNDSPDDKSDDKDNSDDKDKSSKSSSSTGSSDNDRKWSGSGDDICKDAPKDWCEGSSADGDDDCDDACDNCDEEERKHLGCDKTSKDVAATKKLRRRKA